MTDNANITDDDILATTPATTPAGTPASTSELEVDQDQGGQHGQDSGDEPTELEDDRDQGGEGPQDTGDES